MKLRRGLPMAKTKKCPQCAETVMADAKICRFCGFILPEIQKAKHSGFWKTLIFVVCAGWAIMAVVAAFQPNTKTSGAPSSTETTSAAESKSAEAKKVYDRMAMDAGQAIKNSMRDPDSLVIEQALISEDGKNVCVQYRAKNGFGGMNREAVAFDAGGKPHQSAAYLNKHCRSGALDVTIAAKVGAS